MSHFTDPYSGKKKFFKGRGGSTRRLKEESPTVLSESHKKRLAEAWKNLDKHILEAPSKSEKKCVLTEKQMERLGVDAAIRLKKWNQKLADDKRNQERTAKENERIKKEQAAAIAKIRRAERRAHKKKK